MARRQLCAHCFLAPRSLGIGDGIPAAGADTSRRAAQRRGQVVARLYLVEAQRAAQLMRSPDVPSARANCGAL